MIASAWHSWSENLNKSLTRSRSLTILYKDLKIYPLKYIIELYAITD